MYTPPLQSVTPPISTTKLGTPYLMSPGVIPLACTKVLPEAEDPLRRFIGEFGFSDDYMNDSTEGMTDAEWLVKFSGQLDYMSFGRGRTKNENAGRYFSHILESGHGSVTEGPNLTFLFYGISRSVTHELVRHRAGFAFSQVSQRYVGADMVRFVERPEYVENERLHTGFLQSIDHAVDRYRQSTELLLEQQHSGDPGLLSGDARTELRKKVQQAARESLPNCTEAPIVVTANLRAWRHFTEMRANAAAEIEIRMLAMTVHAALRDWAPLLFADHKDEMLSDGTMAIQTDWRKV